jgi:hypothetical protein
MPWRVGLSGGNNGSSFGLTFVVLSSLVFNVILELDLAFLILLSLNHHAFTAHLILLLLVLFL